MNLEQTWEETLKMWEWIAYQKLSGSKIGIWKLKETYLEEILNLKNYKDICGLCFFCDYDNKCFGKHCSNCPAKLVDPTFSCYHSPVFETDPVGFYTLLTELNKRRNKMKWMTEKEVKSATNEKEALDLSIEHWRQLSEATIEEFLKEVDREYYLLGAKYCGLCSYNNNECSECVLEHSGNCCIHKDSLYYKALAAKRELQKCLSEENKLNWQITSKNMYKKLLSLKKPELKNGDMFKVCGINLVYFNTQIGECLMDQYGVQYSSKGHYMEQIKNGKLEFINNIFKED